MTAPQDPELTILIVSYNTREMTLACIESALRETTETSSEIIVVDNGSTDGSAAAIATRFPGVQLHTLKENLGFAGGNNFAAHYASGALLLLLNPDTVVRNGAIDRLVACARTHPRAGIWGGRTIFADGSLNPTCCWRRITLWNAFCRASGLTGLFPNSALFNSEAYGGWRRDRVRHVDIVSGCFFLIRKSLWTRLAGFDPRFFMYGEEADLCLRARASGARPIFTPAAEIIHHGGASERTRTGKMCKLLAAKIALIDRHWHWPQRPLGRALLAAWPLSRLAALAPMALLARIVALKGSGAYGESYWAWREIWRRRGEWIAGYAARAAMNDRGSQANNSISPNPALTGEH